MCKNLLGENIKYYRKEQKLTQNELAEMLFVAPQTVSKWEKGSTAPDLDRLCSMADIFGISVDRLVRNAGNRQKEAMIAIDGGGTKTDFVLFEDSGEVIDRIILGGSNPNAYGISTTKEILARGIEKLMAHTLVRTVGVFAGISGAGSGSHREELNAFLKERFPYLKSRVEGDFFNVINCVDDNEKYIAVICGTGSVVYANDGEELHRLGGWGYLFDEAGSGFDLGRDLFRYCLACEDEGRLHDELYVYLSEALGGGVFANIGSVYAKGKDYIASFAPAVFSFYDKGNPAATAIVERTAARLSELIDTAHKNYDCGNLAVIAGGLTSRRDIIEPLIRKGINSEINLAFPEEPPIFGAAVRCLKLFGESVDINAFRKNFKIQ